MIKGMADKPKMDPSAPSPIATPEPPVIPLHTDEDRPVIDYPGLQLIPYNPKTDITSKGVRVSVIGNTHASLTNGMGLHKAYDNRAEHGITGPGYVVDQTMIYPVNGETFQRIDAPTENCKWRIDVTMSSTI